MIVRVPRSFARPHQVKINKDDYQFWARNAAGKYRLDVDQLRAAFLLSETLEERIRSFRRDRLGSIIAGETPIPMAGASKLVLHLVPLDAFDTAASLKYDVSLYGSVAPFTEQRTPKMVWPLNTTNLDNRFNFDGILSYSPLSNEKGVTDSYVQFYRSGILEIVNISLLSHERGQVPLLLLTLIESELIKMLPSYLAFQREIGIDAPVLAMVSLLDVKGRSIPVDHLSFNTSHPIDRDNLVVPEVVIKANEPSVSTILRPIFDTLWNACGRHSCPNYDSKGTWEAIPYGARRGPS